jgi:hypothetical protein
MAERPGAFYRCGNPMPRIRTGRRTMNTPVAIFIAILILAGGIAGYMNYTVSGRMMNTLPPPAESRQP